MIAIRKILSPVDFSEATAASAAYADALACRFNAELTLLHVAPAIDFEFAIAQPGNSRLAEIAEHRNWTARQALARFPGGRLLSRSAKRDIAEGDPAAQIIRASLDGYDLIVMPTRRNGIHRWLSIGSVTTKVLQSVECPVLAGDGFGSPQELSGGRIVCAIDLGSRSLRVLRAAAILAEEFNAQLVVLHAAPELGEAAEDFGDPGWRTTLKSRLCQKVSDLQSEAGCAGPIVIGTGDPHKVVADIAREHKAGVVVIGRGVSDDLIGRLRAHAHAIIRHAPCPVLSI